jgi:hypothetical protein
MSTKKTKKTTSKKRSPSKRQKRSNATKGVLRIRGNLKLEYHASYTSYLAAESELKAANAELRALSVDEKYKPVFKAMLAIDNAKKKLLQTQREVREVALKVADKLGISEEEFSKLSINTETGAVFPTPEAAQTTQ